MSISLTSALLEINRPDVTLARIFEIVGDLSGAVRHWQPDGTYLLFSGVLPDGRRATEMAGLIRNSEAALDGVYDIADSDVGDFMSREGFQLRLQQV